jgi:hypothetical protein
MGKLSVKNGTPVGNEHLCRNCIFGQFTTGYRESDLMVICTNPNPARVVPFRVHECTEFWDRRRPDWEQMEKLAINFSEGRRKPTPGFRGSGFARVPVIVKDEEEDEEEEAARGMARN